MNNKNSLQNRLNYHFSDENLLNRALTHRSAGKLNNERLEFLGDALLDLVISEALYQRYPNASEGELTRFRASLVKGESLAEIAREAHLSEDIILGSGEFKSGGSHRSSILADALEAVFGAVYLDGGLEASRQVVQHLFASRLQSSDALQPTKDAKTQLQEWLQARREPLPKYVVLTARGESHNKMFTVRCEVASLAESPTGEGSSKRSAEMAAAKIALRDLKNLFE